MNLADPRRLAISTRLRNAQHLRTSDALLHTLEFHQFPGLQSALVCPPLYLEWSPLELVSMADLFRDGSASPTDLPNIRLSARSMVRAHPGGSFTKLANGPSPGAFHNILRAETYAVLVALRITIRVNLFVDNSTVVNHLNRLLLTGFDPFQWAAGPDVDLWSAIAAEVIKPPSRVHNYH